MRLAAPTAPEPGDRVVILYICAECDHKNWIAKATEFGHFISPIHCVECGHQIADADEMP